MRTRARTCLVWQLGIVTSVMNLRLPTAPVGVPPAATQLGAWQGSPAWPPSVPPPACQRIVNVVASSSSVPHFPSAGGSSAQNLTVIEPAAFSPASLFATTRYSWPGAWLIPGSAQTVLCWRPWPQRRPPEPLTTWNATGLSSVLGPPNGMAL